MAKTFINFRNLN